MATVFLPCFDPSKARAICLEHFVSGQLSRVARPDGRAVNFDVKRRITFDQKLRHAFSAALQCTSTTNLHGLTRQRCASRIYYFDFEHCQCGYSGFVN